MDYPILNTTAVTKMINDIGQFNHDLAGKTNDTDRAKVTAQIQSQGIKLEERLNKDIRILKGYFTARQDRATRWLAKSQNELKDATTLAADFKKNPHAVSAILVLGLTLLEWAATVRRTVGRCAQHSACQSYIWRPGTSGSYPETRPNHRWSRPRLGLTNTDRSWCWASPQLGLAETA